MLCHSEQIYQPVSQIKTHCCGQNKSNLIPGHIVTFFVALVIVRCYRGYALFLFRFSLYAAFLPVVLVRAVSCSGTHPVLPAVSMYHTERIVWGWATRVFCPPCPLTSTESKRSSEDGRPRKLTSGQVETGGRQRFSRLIMLLWSLYMRLEL